MESGGPWTARSRRRAKAGPAPASRTGNHHATILGSCNSLGVTKHEVYSKRSRPSFERKTIVLKGRVLVKEKGWGVQAIEFRVAREVVAFVLQRAAVARPSLAQ